MNFKEMYLSGLCDFDHIDQCIGQWHDSTENGLELIDHLGLTQAEYGLFLRQDPAATLQSCLNSQRHCQHYRIYQLDLSDGKTVPFAFAGIQKMRELISDLPKHYGITVIVSSHLLSEIDQMAEDVGIIDKGRMIYQGSLRKLHDKAKGSIHIHVMNPAAAISVLREQKEDYEQNGKVLIVPEREDIRLAELIARLAGKGAQITRVVEQQKSLEDIFLKLTGKQVSL